MEQEIITIATLTIDSEKAVGTIEQTKKSIWELQQANTDLRKAIKENGDETGESTKTFVAQEAEIKRLNAVYKTQQSAINEVTLAQVKESSSIKENVKSIDQANAQNKELLKTRNQVDATTKDGAKAIELLNAKMNENNKFILANKNEQEKASAITGNYRQHMFNLGNSFGGASQKAIGFVQQGKEIASSFGALSNTVVSSAKNIVGFGNASKITAVQSATLASSEIAVGAGAQVASTGTNTATKSTWMLNVAMGTLLLPITAIVAIAYLLYKAFSTFQPLVDKVEQAMAALTAVFNVAKNTVLALVTGAKSLKEAFSGLGSEMASAARDAAKLEKAQQDLADSMEQQEVSTARARAEINALGAALLNKTLSDKERSKIAGDIATKEQALFVTRENSVNKEIAQAKEALRIKAGLKGKEVEILNSGSKAIKDNLEKRTVNIDKEVEILNKARLKAIDIENERTENVIKAFNKQDKFDEKAKEAQEKRQSDAIAQGEKNAQKQQELNAKAHEKKLKNLADSVIVFETEKHTVEEQLSFYVKYYADLNALQNGDEKIKNAQELSAKILGLAKEQISEEIKTQTDLIKSKKELSKQEQTDLLANAQFLKEAETKRIENSLLNEKDKATALEEIHLGFLANVAIINKSFEDSENIRKEEQKVLDTLDFQIKLIDIEEQGLQENEMKLSLLKAEHEERLRLISLQLDKEGNLTKKAVKEKEIEDRKYAQATKAIDKQVAAQKKAMGREIIKQSLEAASIIFEDNKALSVATALMSTYEGIAAQIATKPKTPYEIGLVIANSAVVAATGFSAVRNILKTTKGSSDTGGGSTSVPSQTFVNPAKTDVVAQLQAPQPQQGNQIQTVLVLETLDEVKNNQQIKIKSN